MELSDIFILIGCAILCFAFGQIDASGNIGNRSYSIWYSTHCLIEKKGLCKLIYYKPKHFDRYTLYEVITFFVSFVLIAVFALLAFFCCAGVLDVKAVHAVAFVTIGLIIISQLVIVLINDIGAHRDEKKKFYLEHGEREVHSTVSESSSLSGDKLMSEVIRFSARVRNQPYFTVYHLWDSYFVRLKQAKKDEQKRNQVNLDYIEYFKNVEFLVVVKENKNGSLQLKIQK